jgi:hypothetical protein
MASIETEIRAAAEQMVARAAEFDETKTMDGYTVGMAFNDATKNLRSAQARVDYARDRMTPDVERKRYLEDARRDILDFLNCGALALSLLPAPDDRGDS